MRPPPSPRRAAAPRTAPPTWQVAHNAELNDWYAAYNKPVAVQDFLANYKGTMKEEYLLLLDADMLLRHPFLPEEFNISRGMAMAAEYNYMKVRGCCCLMPAGRAAWLEQTGGAQGFSREARARRALSSSARLGRARAPVLSAHAPPLPLACRQGNYNGMALRHVPEIAPRNDSLAGPRGRRGDVVGAPYFMHAEDARRLAPLWYNYSVRVRNDSEVRRLGGC